MSEEPQNLDLRRPKKILIVDDDDGIRMMLETKLFKMGYKAYVAANGLHALQKLRAADQSDLYDMVICDMKMPGMCGLEFIKNLRGDPNFKSLPVLLITGYAEKAKIMEVVRLGISRVLLKPFKHNQIVGLVEEILNDPNTSVVTANAA